METISMSAFLVAGDWSLVVRKGNNRPGISLMWHYKV